MRTRSILLALADALQARRRSWLPTRAAPKLNTAKSKITPGAAQNNMVVITATGDQMKVVVDGHDGTGKPVHNEWVGKFDGKDYPVTGDPSVDKRWYKATGDNAWEVAQKKSGEVTTSGTVTISADGKTRTVDTKGTTPRASP